MFTQGTLDFLFISFIHFCGHSIRMCHDFHASRSDEQMLLHFNLYVYIIKAMLFHEVWEWDSIKHRNEHPEMILRSSNSFIDWNVMLWQHNEESHSAVCIVVIVAQIMSIQGMKLKSPYDIKLNISVLCYGNILNS